MKINPGPTGRNPHHCHKLAPCFPPCHTWGSPLPQVCLLIPYLSRLAFRGCIQLSQCQQCSDLLELSPAYCFLSVSPQEPYFLRIQQTLSGVAQEHLVHGHLGDLLNQLVPFFPNSHMSIGTEGAKSKHGSEERIGRYSCLRQSEMSF